MSKAQASIEFFVLSGMAFLIIIVFGSLTISEIKEFSGTKEYNLLKDVGTKLQKEVTIATAVEDGYSRTFEIPSKLQGTVDYGITTTNTTITINSTKTVFTVAIPEITGNFSKGSNMIEKTGGILYVNR